MRSKERGHLGRAVRNIPVLARHLTLELILTLHVAFFNLGFVSFLLHAHKLAGLWGFWKAVWHHFLVPCLVRTMAAGWTLLTPCIFRNGFRL